VVKFSTRREYNGKTLINRNLSIIATNPVYEMADNEVYQQDISLPFFKFAYFKNLSDISSKITVVRQG
jgi:hypothetical protein